MKELKDVGAIIRDIDKTHSTVRITADKRSTGRPYKSLPYTMRPALEKIADYVRVTMIPNTFKAEGPGWKRLSRRATTARIAAGFRPGPILYRTGELFDELTDRTHPRHVEIIKVGKYARVEIGASSVKFLENQQGIAAKHLPARPMIPGTGNIPLQDRDRDAIREILYKAVRGAIVDRI